MQVAMLLFVDFIDADGRYRASSEAAFMAPSMPVAVLTAVVFLEASGLGDAAEDCRIYHVEGARFLSSETLDEAGVDELDTLIVVNCDEAEVTAQDELGLSWQAHGGTARRLSAGRGTALAASARPGRGRASTQA
jgi:hypothetical protein